MTVCSMVWNFKGKLMRLNSNLIRATLTGALGGLLFGFDTVVISGAIDCPGPSVRIEPK